MTFTQQILTIGLCAAATMVTRFLPFFVFSENRPTPKYVQYLGKVLPLAIFAMLIVYCLRNVDWTAGSHGLPEVISIAAVTGVHLWKKNMMLSIAVGTVLYMVLLHFGL